MKNIMVHFSGWLEISPEKLIFVYDGPEARVKMGVIDGAVWSKLKEEDKKEYMLMNVYEAQTKCEDIEYTEIELTEQL
jgi:hypothetical protein